MSGIQLIAPGPGHEAQALAFAHEVMAADGDGIHGSCELYTTRPYHLWLSNVTRLAAGEHLPHLSPADTFFAMAADGTMVGIINIRHGLQGEFMAKYGGHIGYTVRPSQRGRGYARQMLHLALAHCRRRGIDRVLITCDPENAASCRTVEACGGTAEGEIPYEDTGEWVRRYWIHTGTIQGGEAP